MSITKACLVLMLVISMVVLDQCENTTPPEYRRLFRLPRKQQAEEFKKYPLEQQVDIYIYAIQGAEPPATQFGDFLASNGKKVIPLVLKRLKEEKSDRVRLYLIEVLYSMHTEYCRLKDEKEVVETIRAVISDMKDATYKRLCELSLKAILEQPGSSISC